MKQHRHPTMAGAFDVAWSLLKQDKSQQPSLEELTQHFLPLDDAFSERFSHYNLADVEPPTEEGRRLINARTNPRDLTFTSPTGNLMRLTPPSRFGTSPFDSRVRESAPLLGPHITPEMIEYYSRFLNGDEKK